MGETVTIEKTHLATLMRRANLHGPEVLQYDPQALADSVTVPRQYLEDLKKSLREYNALRSALIRGGVTLESLDLLVQENFDTDQTALDQSVESSDAGGIPLFEGSRSGYHDNIPRHYPGDNQYHNYAGKGPHGYGNVHGQTWNFHNQSGIQEQGQNGNWERQYHNKPMGGSGVGGMDFNSDPNHVRNGQGKRTIYLSKLPDRVTYAKIFDVIRGGAVVDVWVKQSDHAASVSFVECSAAESFYQYARKNDIYIDGRRINVDWREPSRQFVILNNIMSAISRGATRSLLLSKAPPTITEARIRDDLDHIHNLHIEKIEFRGGSVLINLNSVCVALFARTCLMSRSAYKGVKIEFAVDECSGRLPTPQNRNFEIRQTRQTKQTKQKAAPKNMFDALAMDDDGDGGDDEEDGDGDEEEEEDGDEGGGGEEESQENADDPYDVSSNDATETDGPYTSPRWNGNGYGNGYGYESRKKSNGNSRIRGWGSSTNGY